MIATNFLGKSKRVILYGAAMAILVFFLKWLEWKYWISGNSIDIYIGMVALLFTAFGIWVANQIVKPKIQTVIVEKEVLVPTPAPNERNEAELSKLALTTREYEVLQLLVKGCSNAEIADRLFLSLSTVKTHVSNLLVKMEVKNRTQAMEKANRLGLVP